MNRRWALAGLVASAWAALAATGCESQAQSGPPKMVPIAVYDPPITRTVTDYEEFPGQTEAIYSVQVTARVSGYMDKVYFKDGSLVEPEAKLFQIDPRMYEADLARAKGTVEQYEAHVERTSRDYERAKGLKARKAIGQEEFDRIEGDHKEAKANLEVARGNLKLAQLNVDWTEVRSPIGGMLSRRMIDPGNLVKADTTILTSIVSLDPLYVYFDVDERSMLRLKRLIQEGKLHVLAQGPKAVPVQIGLSDEPDFPHRGIVDFLDNKVDLNTGTLRFRATLDNPADARGNRFIIPGLFVRVRLPIGEPHKALLVREQALMTDQGRKSVYVVRPKKDDKGQPVLDAKGQPVYVAMVRDVGVPGVLRDGFREIEKGIEPGDWVVVNGMQRLRPGAEVKPERYEEPKAAEAETKTGEAQQSKAEATQPKAEEAQQPKAEATQPKAGETEAKGGSAVAPSPAPKPKAARAVPAPRRPAGGAPANASASAKSNNASKKSAALSVRDVSSNPAADRSTFS